MSKAFILLSQSLFIIRILRLYLNELKDSIHMWNETPSTHHIAVSSPWALEGRTAPFRLCDSGQLQPLRVGPSNAVLSDGYHCLMHWEGDKYEQANGGCDLYPSWSWGCKVHCFHRAGREHKCLKKRGSKTTGRQGDCGWIRGHSSSKCILIKKSFEIRGSPNDFLAVYFTAPRWVWWSTGSADMLTGNSSAQMLHCRG